MNLIEFLGAGRIRTGIHTNGAWDFAADTRGYTRGLVLAREQPRWALRAGAAMMPTTSIGNPGMNADRGPAFVAGLRLHAHI